jgi:tetratricopeptide (TPR) repeat protein
MSDEGMVERLGAKGSARRGRSRVRAWQVALFLFLIAPLLFLWLARSERPYDGPGSGPGSAQVQHGEAIERAKRNAAARPSHDTFLELGYRYYLNRQFRESIVATERALAFDPNSSVAYSNLCSAYTEMGMWDKAVEAGRRAVSIDPNFPLAKNNLHWALRKMAESSPAPECPSR